MENSSASDIEVLEILHWILGVVGCRGNLHVSRLMLKLFLFIHTNMNSIEKVWARATGHLMGHTDDDRPDVPVLTLREARVALFLKTFWVIIHTVTCFFIMANTIRHW